MRNLFCGLLAAAMLYFVLSAQAQTPAPSKTAPPKKAAATAPAKTAATKASPTAAGTRKAPAGTAKTAPRPTVASKSGKKAQAKRAPAPTWRNRQIVPTPDRYKEIQQALAAKGYLKPEDANGAWGQNSIQAMQKFQADQKLESTGKINSLSLIALGLGPKPASPIVPASPPEAK